MSSAVHVSTPYASLNSHRFADALANVVALDSKASADELSSGRERPREIVFSDTHPPGYGFGPATKLGGRVYRAIRDGRSEALLVHRAPAEASNVTIEVSSDTPPDLLRMTSLAVNGETAQRIETQDAHLLRWRLPKDAMRYGGWMEILLSTRGLSSWPGDALDPAASGPQLEMARVLFD
jgi:hypothetical protein